MTGAVLTSPLRLSSGSQWSLFLRAGKVCILLSMIALEQTY